GFVSYLMRQLRWELNQLGLPNIVLWQDRAKIEPGDIWSDAIAKTVNNAELFVVILTKNYLNSPWCQKELEVIESRIARLDPRKHRFFRVEKHGIQEAAIPEPLRRIEAVRFYREDDEAKAVDEYFWGGKVRLIEQYEEAVHDLALAIYKQLHESRKSA